MSKQSHEFEQYPSEHPGWDRKHFELRGRRWPLLVIDRPDERRSMISERDGRTLAPPWQHWHHLTIDGILTVDGAVTIIDRIFSTFEQGTQHGQAVAKASIRAALGIAQ